MVLLPKDVARIFREAAEVVDTNRHVFSCNAVRLAARDAGVPMLRPAGRNYMGPALMPHHFDGIVGTTHGPWRHVRPEVARSHRVLALLLAAEVMESGDWWDDGKAIA